MDRSDLVNTDQTVSAAIAGDEPAFAALTERHRRELHVHCYRMLASFDEAEDAVQETFLKAWRGRSGFDGGSQFRAWLYRIATNVCLDMLRRSSRRTAGYSHPEVPWLQPYPDQLLDAAAPSDEQPEAVAIQRETISLAFLAALQVLPPRQRAALIARDVVGWPAAETASALGTSVAAANSALQRARATMQSHLPARRAEWSAREPSAEERNLVDQFIQAHERCDAEAAVAIAARDIRVTMPPAPWRFEGPDAIRPLMADAASMGEWRLVPVGANRMPAAASYLRRPGDGEFRAFKLDVMRIEAGLITEITTFNAELFPAFGLPPTLLAVPHALRIQISSMSLRTMASTSGSDRTTVVPAAGTFPSSSPRTICTVLMPTATLPAQYRGWSSTKTAASAVTPSRSSAHRKISAAGLAAPTSHDRTRASASTSTPSDASNGRVFSVQLLTTAILMPWARSVHRNGRTSSYRRAFASSSSASRRTISPTRPGCACRPDASRIWPNASAFDIRPSVSKAPSRLYSASQMLAGMPASAGTSVLSTEKSQVTIVS